MKLIALDDFYALAELGESHQDPEVARVIELVSAGMETVMDRWLKKQAYTESLQPNGGERMLRVKAYPVASSPALTIVDYGASLATSDYQLHLTDGRIFLKTRSWQSYGYPTVTITYTGGYPEVGVKEQLHVAVPDDLKFACYLQSQYIWRNRKDLGLTSVSMGGANIALAPADWLPAVKDILRRNTRLSV